MRQYEVSGGLSRCNMPRKRDDDCLQELRWLYDRRNLEEARSDLAAWLSR